MFALVGLLTFSPLLLNSHPERAHIMVDVYWHLLLLHPDTLPYLAVKKID
jgi:hypothetical protein